MDLVGGEESSCAWLEAKKAGTVTRLCHHQNHKQYVSHKAKANTRRRHTSMRSTYACLGVHFILIFCAVALVESFAPPRKSPYLNSRVSVAFRTHHSRGVKRRRSCPSSYDTATSLYATPVALPYTSANAGISTILTSLHADNSFVLSAILIVSACGIALEQETTIGKALSAPLVTMLISLCLANIGTIPFNSPVCKCKKRRNLTYILFYIQLTAN